MSHRKLTMKFVRKVTLVLFALMLLSIFAEAVQANTLVGPFEFSFFTSRLNNLFLLPFTLGGCLPSAY
jgi:hypothetical protein